jgi:hypothetical protein
MKKEFYVSNLKITKNKKGFITIAFLRINSPEFIVEIDQINRKIIDNHFILEYLIKSSIKRRIIIQNLDLKLINILKDKESIGILEFDSEIPINYHIS